MENKSYLIVTRFKQGKGVWTVDESDIATLKEAKVIAKSFAKQAPNREVQIWEEITKIGVRTVIQ